MHTKISESNDNRKLFSSIFEYSPAAMAISRVSDGKIIDVNESFLFMFGASSYEEVLGKSVAELNIWMEPERRKEMFALMNEKKQVRNFEWVVRTLKGEIKWSSTSVNIIEVNNEPCILGVNIDITEQKKAEEQLLAVNKELEAFTYSVSHDLRSPLRAVSGYAQMLMEDYAPQLDENAQRLINIMKYNAAKMGILIDDLLSFSRLGRKELLMREIDMNELVRGTLSEVNKSLPNCADISISKLHSIKADFGLMYQVMFNLISNAIKYSSRKEKPEIEIYSWQKENEIVFSVKDNGAGFDMQYVQKLCGVFQRLHSEEEFEGTGVGLAIVQRIIHKHGGKVWAEGKVSEGATFHFSLTKI